MPPIVDAYTVFKSNKENPPLARQSLKTMIETGCETLDGLETYRLEATSTSAGKSFFSYKGDRGDSRAINPDIYLKDITDSQINTILDADFDELDSQQINSLIYTVAINTCCAFDVACGNSSRPAYAFEWMIGYLVSRHLGVAPIRTLPELNGVNLPVDLYFRTQHCTIAVPVKITTRERASQAWIQQRILDGIIGKGAVRGLFFLMAETNRVKQQGRVKIQETCVPEQWLLYQKYVSQLHSIFYLDPPVPYWARREQLNIRYMGEFFTETAEVLSSQPSA